MKGASGAESKAVCSEAGMFALRERRIHVTQVSSCLIKFYSFQCLNKVYSCRDLSLSSCVILPGGFRNGGCQGDEEG